MYLLATAVALLSLVPRIFSLTVDTPASMTQCQPTLLTWRQGIPPYYVSVIPGGQTSSPPLETLGTTNGTDASWLVNVTPNQYVNIVVKDSTGDTAFTDQVLVLANNDVGCMNNKASVSMDTSSDTPSTSSSSAATMSATNAHTTKVSQGTTHTIVAVTHGASNTNSRNSATATGSSNSNGAEPGSSYNRIGMSGLLSLLPLVGILLL